MRIFSRLKNLFHCQQCENKNIPEKMYTQKEVNNLTDYWHSKVIQAKAEGRKTAIEEMQKAPPKDTSCEIFQRKRAPRKNNKQRVSSIDDFALKECQFGNLLYIQYHEFYSAYVHSCLRKNIEPESNLVFSHYFRNKIKNIKLKQTTFMEGDENVSSRFFVGVTTCDRSFCKTSYKAMDARKIISEMIEESPGDYVLFDELYAKYCIRISDGFDYPPLIKNYFSESVRTEFNKCVVYRKTDNGKKGRRIHNVAFKKIPAIPSV